MSDINIRTTGVAGRITLTRTKALNALSYEMMIAIEKAVDRWASDDTVQLVVIDAEGDKAFCAGGDIAELYETGTAHNYSFGRKFWADEYRLNAKLAGYGKPIIALMQGFTMGGGVGISCHSRHRVVGDSSRIAMPECGIGLVPDVGGSLLLARAPGRLGEYLGLTGARMGPGDAIYAGFADTYVPEDRWPDLITRLERGDLAALSDLALTAPDSPLRDQQPVIDNAFRGSTLGAIFEALPKAALPQAEKAMGHNSPLSMACALEIIHRVRSANDMIYALEQEYRFTYRAMEEADLLEGIRAQVIDKDRTPKWRYPTWQDVPPAAVLALTMPLGANRLNLEDIL